MARHLLHFSFLLFLAYTSASCTKNTSGGGGDGRGTANSGETGSTESGSTRPGGDATGFQGVITIKVGGIYLHSPDLAPPTPAHFDKALLIDQPTNEGYLFTSAELTTFPKIGDEIAKEDREPVAYTGSGNSLVVDGETFLFNTVSYYPEGAFYVAESNPWKAGFRPTANGYPTFNPMNFASTGRRLEEMVSDPFTPGMFGASFFFNDTNNLLEIGPFWVAFPWAKVLTPGPQNVAVLRFTAPCATNYRFTMKWYESGYFQSGVPVDFLLNGVNHFSGSVSHNLPAAYDSPILSLQTGDNLEYVTSTQIEASNSATMIDLVIIGLSQCP